MTSTTALSPGDEIAVQQGTVSRYLPAGAPRRLRQIARAVDNFLRHDMSTYAAALAYRGLFALFPFLIFVIALVNAFEVWPLFAILADWAESEPQGRLPATIRRWVVLQVRGRAEGAAISVAVGAAVWVVATGARVLRRALNAAGEASDVEAGWRRLVWSLIAAPVVGATVVTGVVLLTLTRRALLRAARWFEVNDAVLFFWDWLRFPAGLLLAGLVISAIYQFAPSHRQPFRVVIPGAAIAALLWTIASLVFSQVISGVLEFGVTYGSFSAAMVLLVYLYLAAGVVLFGAELNAVLTDDRS